MRNFRRSAVETVGDGKELVDSGDSAGGCVASASRWLSSRVPASTPASSSESAAPKSKEKLVNSVGSKAVASSVTESSTSPEEGGASLRWTAKSGWPRMGCGDGRGG